MEFGILGPLVVWRDGLEVPIGAAKHRALLVLLLLRRGELVSTETLVDELWGERPPATAVKALRVYVSQLRRLLGNGLLETRPSGYLLRLEPHALDAARFHDLLTRARALLAGDDPGGAVELLREALGLWRGPPLEEFRYEPFARDEIARLEELRLSTLEERLDLELRFGMEGTIVGELRALAAEHPRRERLQGQLMLALYRSGRQAESLEVYRRLRDVLVEELGIEPSQPIRQLERAILGQDATLDLPAPARQPDGIAEPVPKTATHPVKRAGRPTMQVVGGGIALIALAVALVLVLGHSSSALARIDANFAGAINVGGDHLDDEVRVGSGPGRMASGGGSIWVVNVFDNTVSRVDPATAVAQQTIAVDLDPTALAFGQGALWVACSGTRRLLRIDPQTYKIVQRIPVGNGPSGVALSPGAVWVTNRFDDTITEIDASSGRVERTLDAGPSPRDVTYGLGAIWIANESASSATRLDPRTGNAQTVLVGNGPAAVTVGAGSVWVANALDGTVSRIDPSSNVVVSTITVGLGPSSVLVEAGIVWVADSYAGEVSRIDPGSNRVVKTIAVGNGPQSLAAAGGRVWLSARGAAAVHRGGTLRVALPGDLIDSLDEAIAYAPHAWSLLAMTGDGLVGVKRVSGLDGGTLVPDLATSLPVPTNDGRTYTFQLRSGIKYSNGEPVRASDFRRALERDFLLGSPGVNYYAGLLGGDTCSKKHCDLSRGVVADDRAGTVTLHLRAPDPEFLYKLTLPFADLVPRIPIKPLERLGVPGTGPYMIARHQPTQIVLVRNPYFHEWSAAAQPDGYPDRIVWKLTGSPGRQLTALELGKADYGDLTELGWRAELATRYTAQVHLFPIPGTEGLFLNTRVPPFNSLAARRALNYAIDRARVLAGFGGTEGASVTCQILPPGTPGYEPHCAYTKRPGAFWTGPDLALARKLVASSGTKGEKVVVWSISHPTPEAVARLAVETLDELGYRASLKLFPGPNEYFRAIQDPHGPAQIGFVAWVADFPAASDFMTLFTCNSAANGNYVGSQLCNRGLDRVIDRARLAPSQDQASTNGGWASVDRRVGELAPWVPLVNPREVVVVSRRVGNVQFNPEWGTLIDQLWVK